MKIIDKTLPLFNPLLIRLMLTSMVSTKTCRRTKRSTELEAGVTSWNWKNNNRD